MSSEHLVCRQEDGWTDEMFTRVTWPMPCREKHVSGMYIHTCTLTHTCTGTHTETDIKLEQVPQTQKERPEEVGGRDALCACVDTHITGSRKQEVRGPAVERMRRAAPCPAPLG